MQAKTEPRVYISISRGESQIVVNGSLSLLRLMLIEFLAGTAGGDGGRVFQPHEQEAAYASR